jgi:phosphopantetheinyl transferase
MALATPVPSVSTPWDGPLASLSADAIVCRRAEWEGGRDTLASGSDADGLAQTMLSAGEQSIWNGMSGGPKRKSEWLFGRIAAKEAVRELLWDYAGIPVTLDLIEIAADERGRPLVQGTWTTKLARRPAVTISHSGGVAAAMAALDSALAIGIDIELCARRRRRFEMAAFGAAERQLVATVADAERDEWHLRLWCAKEAASKALGCGLGDGPLDMQVTAVSVETGAVQVMPAAARCGAAAREGGEAIVAHTARAGDCVSAVVLHRRGERPPRSSGNRAR